MNEKYQALLDQYNISIDRQRRNRGSIMCYCGNDLYILSPTTLSEDRVALISQWSQCLSDAGFPLIDQYIKNVDDHFLSYNRYYESFALRKTFHGVECDVHNMNDMAMAAKNLGKFHSICANLAFSTECVRPVPSIKKQYSQKALELNGILRYIRTKKNKGPFEYMFLEDTEEYWVQMEDALSYFSRLQSPEKGWCHGNYNHHNLLICHDQLATLHFDRFLYGYPILDLYYFLRKVLEKNDYQYSFCQCVLDNYTLAYPLSANDHQWIYSLLLFPEKFWKIANQYMNHRKHWVSPRYIEKLNKFIETKEIRQNFLEKHRENYDIF